MSTLPGGRARQAPLLPTTATWACVEPVAVEDGNCHGSAVLSWMARVAAEKR